MSGRPQRVVIDTNVPVAANGRSQQASADCEEDCRSSIKMAMRGEVIPVVDEGFEIFTEYMHNLSLAGQRGLGDLFLKWIHDNQFNPGKCERVSITPHLTRGYVEFPDDPELQQFDPADRKFVAVARACESSTRVLNALDPGWWDYRDVLEKNDVRVEFVCDDQVAAWKSTRTTIVSR